MSLHKCAPELHLLPTGEAPEPLGHSHALCCLCVHKEHCLKLLEIRFRHLRKGSFSPGQTGLLGNLCYITQVPPGRTSEDREELTGDLQSKLFLLLRHFRSGCRRSWVPSRSACTPAASMQAHSLDGHYAAGGLRDCLAVPGQGRDSRGTEDSCLLWPLEQRC